MSTAEEATTTGENSSSEEALGADASAALYSWVNVKSRLRMGPLRESTVEGREIHQHLAAPRNYQQWRLIEVGKDNQDVLYRIENVRSGLVLDTRAHEAAGSVVVQRAYEGDDVHEQQWKLIPVGSESATPRVYEIVNRKSGQYLRVDTNARVAIKLGGADEGEPQQRQWQLLPV
ncbi:RICIN domain-containing protein [Streptomyces sp. YH02]|uniref:RICIN domain-containing protein n=1 Tax=Streptomyces sp. YH02 TaxID=3256999 RepID=UPI003756E39F